MPLPTGHPQLPPPTHDLPPTNTPQMLWGHPSHCPPSVASSPFPLSLPFFSFSPLLCTHPHSWFSCPLSQFLPPPPSPDSFLPSHMQHPHTSESPSEHLNLSQPSPIPFSGICTGSSCLCILRNSLCLPAPAQSSLIPENHQQWRGAGTCKSLDHWGQENSPFGKC